MFAWTRWSQRWRLLCALALIQFCLQFCCVCDFQGGFARLCFFIVQLHADRLIASAALGSWKEGSGEVLRNMCLWWWIEDEWWSAGVEMFFRQLHSIPGLWIASASFLFFYPPPPPMRILFCLHGGAWWQWVVRRKKEIEKCCRAGVGGLLVSEVALINSGSV